MADRPGELEGRQPVGDRLGSPGPDQGYVITLGRTLVGTLQLGTDEHESDALAVVQAVALKRASLFGRAPVIHDLTAAVSVLGFDVAAPTGDAADRRRMMIEEAHHPHCYDKLRAVVDLVDADGLHRPLTKILDDGQSISW